MPGTLKGFTILTHLIHKTPLWDEEKLKPKKVKKPSQNHLISKFYTNASCKLRLTRAVSTCLRLVSWM